MRFLVDAQLPPALARMLADLGHEACHVDDLGLRHASDTHIWNHALSNSFVIVTKDEDFPHRLRQTGVGPVIVWLRVGNTSCRSLLQWFEALLPRIETLIQSGETLIEVR